jgi:Tfp pilus assembly protein PilW
MTQRTLTPDVGAERGTTIVEVVIGLLLVATAAGLLAQLMTSTARATPEDTIEPDASLALELFSRDVREAAHVEVSTTRGRATTVTLVSDTATVRWSLAGDELLRGADPRPTPRIMAVGLDDSSGFSLEGADGSSIAADDAIAVRWCTRLVELSLVGDDWTAVRGSVLRVESDTGACP